MHIHLSDDIGELFQLFLLYIIPYTFFMKQKYKITS